MKKRLLNIITLLLTVFILIPVLGVNTVNAATPYREEQFLKYLTNQGGMISSYDTNITQISYVGPNIINFRYDGNIYSNNLFYYMFFDYNLKTHEIYRDGLTLVAFKGYKTGYNVLTAKITPDYSPSSTPAIFDTTYFNDSFSKADQTALMNVFKPGIAQAMKAFDNTLVKHGFCLGDLGFTNAAFQHRNLTVPTPKIIGTLWQFENENGNSIYDTTDVKAMYAQLSVAGYTSPITSKIYFNGKLICEAESSTVVLNSISKDVFVYYNGQLEKISTLHASGDFLPEGTYKVEFYNNGKLLTSISTKIYESSLHTSLPGFTPSTSGSGVDGFVTRLYKVVLGRNPDSTGKADWIKKLTNKTITGGSAATSFLTSKEFTAKGYTDRDFVEILYRTFFNRNSDIAGLEYWLKKISNGTSRTEVIKSFINSNEWATICAQYGIASGGTGKVTPSKATTDFVTRLYTKCLGRNASTSDVDYWAQKLATKELSGSQVAQKFFFGSEFTGKKYSNEEFVKRLYRTCMNREPSSSDVTYWVNKLKSGTSRQALFNNFVSKAEFVNLCKNAGINP